MSSNAESLKSIEELDLLSAIAALDRMGRKEGFRPLDPHDETHRSSETKASVLLRGRVSLGFATRDVHQVQAAPDSGEAYALSSPALTLAGAMGPLPLAITEDLLARAGAGDRAGLDFLDLFHGRLLRLFYLIRKRSRPALGAATGARTAQARMLRHLTHLPQSQWLRHAGLQSALPQSAASISQILSERLLTPLQVSGLQGVWEPIGSAASADLSDRPSLGRSAVVGQRYWNPTGSMRIDTPPVQAHHLAQWLPGGERYVMLCSLLKTVLQKTMTVHLRIRPDGASVPVTRLHPETPLRLGQSAWIKTGTQTVRVSDVNLSLSGLSHGR